MGLNDYKLGLKNKKRPKMPRGPKGKKQGLLTQSVKNRLSTLRDKLAV